MIKRGIYSFWGLFLGLALLSIQTQAVLNSQAFSSNYRSEWVQPESIRLLQNGDSLPAVEEIAKTAEKYLYINVLSFTCDESTEKLVETLKLKASQGVDVRIITNQYFAPLSFFCLQDLKRSGIGVLKTKTHSSYIVNDQKQLLIGSQSFARFFFHSNGKNGWDRDMMLWAKGPLATDAVRDFEAIWTDDAKEFISEGIKDRFQKNQKAIVEEKEQGLRGEKLKASSGICRFVSQNPRLGISEIQSLWQELGNLAVRNLTFSGVKVDIGDGNLGRVLKAASARNVDVRYKGNSESSGNGELTMVLNEWIQKLKTLHLGFVAEILEKLRDSDSQRVAGELKKLYQDLQSGSKIQLDLAPEFIHYKVWQVDENGSFVGSANLDENKFAKVYDSGVFCLDEGLAKELKLQIGSSPQGAGL